MANRPARPAVFDYRPPLALRLIKGTLAALAGAAILCVVYTVYWFYVASAFRDGLPAWIEDNAGPGATLTYRQLEISGYPFQFRLILTEPVLDAPALPAAGDKRVRWKASRVLAMMAPWDWDSFTVDLAGSHELDVPSERGQTHIFARADSLKSDIELHDDGHPETVVVDLAGVRIQDSSTTRDTLWAVGRGHVEAQRLFPLGDLIDKPTFTVKFQIQDARLPPRDLPLGRDLARLAGEVKVLGVLTDPGSVEALTKWRDAGGTLEFNLTESRYGPLSMTANGTAALDQSLQPVAAMTASVQGLFPTIDALRDRGLIRSRDAGMAKVVLGVMARPGEGGQPTISLPFTIQDGKLSAATVPLLDIPPIEWPEPRNERPRFIR